MTETTPDPADVHTGTDRVETKLYLIRNSKTGEWFMGSIGGDDGIWAKNIAMSVVYSSQTGPRSGLPDDGEWVEFRAALTPEGKDRADRVDAEDGGR